MTTVIDTTNLLQGSCNVYVGAFGAAEPADPTTAGTWTDLNSSIWVPAGATSGGVKLAAAMTYKSIEVDQVPDEVGVRMTGRSTEVSTTLSEITLANIKSLMNGGTVTTGAATTLGTVTIVAATGVLTVSAAHGLAVNDPIKLGAITSTTGVTAGTVYYVRTVPSTTTLTLSATLGGSALTLSTDGNAASIARVLWEAFEPLSSTQAFQPTYSALCLEGPATGTTATFLRRVFVRKVLSTSGFDMEWKKDTPQGITAKWGGYYVSDSVKPFRIINQLG